MSGYLNRWNLTLNKWDVAHMKTAKVYASLSSARRLKVGAVIVRDNRIISIGYNGMPSGWDNNCEDEIGAYVKPTLKTKPEVIHAESNAITKVAASTEQTKGAVLYTTHAPCVDCAKLIHQCGIERVVYGEDYPKGTEGLTFLDKCGIIVENLGT